METSISYCGGEYAYFSSDEHKWRNRITKLAEDHPDCVEIIRRPEDNDGCVYARIPADWVKIQPKKSINWSDEQRIALVERLKKSDKKDA